MTQKLISIIFLLLPFSMVHLESNNELKNIDYNALKFRSIGPAFASGRISDIAINPNNYDEFYIAVASGGVWKTTNHGNNFSPIFDNQNSYSIGCISIDPSNPHIIWVGTGENNSQRSVSYGDGVYKSTNGGKTWDNMGLKNSEHIGKIIIDPNNSDIIWVASQGPLWNSGGDRGLFKTIDGGKSWDLVLNISENTGITDIVMDPRDSKVIYAASYQRRRHVWTLINGGPESAIYFTKDGGKNWDKLENGLPTGDIGRIGLAIAESNPDYLYATIEASGSQSGFYKSINRGASWEKVNSIIASSPQYYQEIFVHPKNENIIVLLSSYSSISYDGGVSWNTFSLKERHVDDHALWFNPKNNNNIIIGGDGGLYESWDAGKTWRFFENLPITQFYRVSVDNDYPFYNVYGGTQDNNSIGGPSQTTSSTGITNQDWFYTLGGDGFKTVVDPKDPNIIYSQPQYGYLVRYDKITGEFVGIQPQPEENEILKWNWNSPLLISPHDNSTLYFAANKVFKTTDKGNSWKKISDDLSRNLNRNLLKVMGKIWPPEAVSKNASTSVYGNIVSLDESPKLAGLIYAGTDDGLIQVTENDGLSWTKYNSFVDVPEMTYVSDITASIFNENIVYATFDNRKRGDFKPYILKSNNKGKSWTSIKGNLPDNCPVHSIIQDHLNENLLFIGTEFGLYFTLDEGNEWIKLKSGLPTISIRDIDIQRRENDLVLATFGRGFYILDDYSPLRYINKNTIEKEAHIFPIKNALMFVNDRSKGKNTLGETFFRAPNPEFGATFTYYIKDGFESLKSKRDKKYKSEENNTYTSYPTFEELREEDNEKKPFLLFVIRDENGNEVRRIKKNYSKGLGRISWDLRYPDTSPINERTREDYYSGFPVLPGKYSVELQKVTQNKILKLTEPEFFECKLLDKRSIPLEDTLGLYTFRNDAFEVRKVIEGANQHFNKLEEEIKRLEKAIILINNVPLETYSNLNKFKDFLLKISTILYGDNTLKKRNAAYYPGINERLGRILYGFWYSNSDATETHIMSLKQIKKEYKEVYKYFVEIENEIRKIKSMLNEKNSPYIDFEIPNFK